LELAPIGGIVEVPRIDVGDQRGLTLATRSDLPIKAQITAVGATWLDRQIVSRERVSVGSRLRSRGSPGGTSPGAAGLRFGSGRNCRLELWSQAHTRYQLSWHIKRLAEITSDQEQRRPWRGSRYRLPRTGGPPNRAAADKDRSRRSLSAPIALSGGNRQPIAKKTEFDQTSSQSPTRAALKHVLGGSIP
jgi:hypothetical protein